MQKKKHTFPPPPPGRLIGRTWQRLAASLAARNHMEKVSLSGIEHFVFYIVFC